MLPVSYKNDWSGIVGSLNPQSLVILLWER